MSAKAGYMRVMPRDLFNEASLLKCLGRLWIELEARARGKAELRQGVDGAPFEIDQNAGSGAISVDSLWLSVGDTPYRLERPLNSRGAWPLYAIRMGDPDEEEIDVFTDDGAFTPKFAKLLGLECVP